MIIKSRDMLACLAVLENGDWDHIYQRVKQKDAPLPEEVERIVKSIPTGFITMEDPEYPKQLLEVYKPPFVLFYQGDISLLTNPEQKMIAVIGSREYSSYGEEATKKIVSQISKDYPIVSGLAKGIDAIAAKEAINCGGKTIAVIGSGLNICYPEENYELYLEIKRNHLLLSEYPFGVSPDRSHFPMRNRIIAGLSDSVLVTEAGRNSGTCITVAIALQTGRDILCVPYPYDGDSTCNRLIKEGAFLVENGDDVKETMEIISRKKYYYGH